ncbi:hypothetical protein [Streptomyces sp. NPDC046197]|uniref:hypothetical protein n=1 Tax=Streptomyces sp. NPDC046197 TaxID=3154337 RepID=UPI003403F685
MQPVSGRYDKCRPHVEKLRRAAEAHRDPLAKTAHQFTSGAIMYVRGRFGQTLAEFDAAIEHIDSLPGGDRQQVPTYRRRVPIRIYRALTLWLIGEQTRAARQRDELLLLSATRRPMTGPLRSAPAQRCPRSAAMPTPGWVPARKSPRSEYGCRDRFLPFSDATQLSVPTS